MNQQEINSLRDRKINEQGHIIDGEVKSSENYETIDVVCLTDGTILTTIAR